MFLVGVIAIVCFFLFNDDPWGSLKRLQGTAVNFKQRIVLAGQEDKTPFQVAENYFHLKRGMSESEVESLLGWRDERATERYSNPKQTNFFTFVDSLGGTATPAPPLSAADERKGIHAEWSVTHLGWVQVTLVFVDGELRHALAFGRPGLWDVFRIDSSEARHARSKMKDFNESTSLEERRQLEGEISEALRTVSATASEQRTTSTADQEPGDNDALQPPAQAGTLSSEYRVFTSKTGRVQVSARVVSLHDQMVVLQREDNSKQVEVQLDQLSDEDQRWLNAQQASR